MEEYGSEVTSNIMQLHTSQWLQKISAFFCACAMILVSIPIEVKAESPLCTSLLDISLVIDRSGSMGGQKINDALSAAQDFTNLLNPLFHEVGLVSFSDNATFESDVSPEGHNS